MTLLSLPAITTAQTSPRSLGSGTLVLLAALAFPLVAMEGYQLFQVSMMLSYAVTLLGLNLLTGWTGQISVGHGAFVALGAYVAALLMKWFGLPYWLAIPAATIVSFAAGFLLGIPALRFEGHHLALLTFVLAICLPQVLKAPALSGVTGGVGGISFAKPMPPAWLPLDEDLYLYAVSCVVFLIAFYLAWNLGRSRIGRALLAIREQPTAASAMGVNVPFFKTMIFGISAAFAGAGGALSAVLVQYVSPESFSIFLSVSLLVGVVVGGLGWTSGAIYGAIFIQYVPTLAENVSKAIPWTVYGALLIAVVFIAPDGVAGLCAKGRALVCGWFSNMKEAA
jgi:branched-chain amino acid transport system permease protein